jgi:hypothetical protein
VVQTKGWRRKKKMIFPLLLMKALLRSNNNRKKMGLTLALSEHSQPKMAVINWRLFQNRKKKKIRIEDKVYYVLRLFGCLNWFVSRWPLTMSNLHPTYPGHKTLDKNLHRSRFLLFEIENKKMISRKWDHNGVLLRKIQNCPREEKTGNQRHDSKAQNADGWVFFLRCCYTRYEHISPCPRRECTQIGKRPWHTTVRVPLSPARFPCR